MYLLKIIAIIKTRIYESEKYKYLLVLIILCVLLFAVPYFYNCLIESFVSYNLRNI